jgi:hypothetical protein
VQQAARNGDQQAVSGGVALGVVNSLEVVQIDGEDRDRFLRHRASRGVHPDPFVEECPVCQAGERVVGGFIVQPLPELSRLGDVAEVADNALDVRVGEQVRSDDFDPAPGTVRALHTHFSGGSRVR